MKMGLEFKQKIATRILTKLEAAARNLIYVSLTILLILLVVLLSPLIASILFYRYAVKIWAGCFCPDLGKMVTTRSSYFTNVDHIYVEPKMNVLLTLVLKGHLSLEKAQEGFGRRWINKIREGSGELEAPELQQYPVSRFGFYFWKWDKNVRAENHVMAYDWKQKYAKLDSETIVSVKNELLTKAFTPNQSPWEWYVLNTHETENPEALTYLILRIHHSLGDGKAILKAISQCCISSGDKFFNRVTPKPVSVIPIKNSDLAVATVLLRKIASLSKFSPYNLVKHAFQPQDNNRLVLRGKDLSWKLNAAVTTDIPVELIKKIKNAHGVTFSTVIFTGVTGALRNFMLENSISVPEVVHCITPLPIPGHSQKLRNYSSFGTLPLPVGLPNTESKLRFIENAFINLKESPLPLLCFYCMSLIGSLPAVFGRAFGFESTISAHVSNFAGPIKPTDMFGYEMKYFWFSPANMGLGVTCMSYAGNLNLVVSMDKNIFPLEVSIKSIRDKIIEEFNILSEAQPMRSC